jgi:hypothetical protein
LENHPSRQVIAFGRHDEMGEVFVKVLSIRGIIKATAKKYFLQMGDWLAW